MNKTERLINRIKDVDNFENVAYVCEDFETFVDEVAEWGVDHIAGVDFDDPELDLEALDDFFGSFLLNTDFVPTNCIPVTGQRPQTIAGAPSILTDRRPGD